MKGVAAQNILFYTDDAFLKEFKMNNTWNNQPAK